MLQAEQGGEFTVYKKRLSKIAGKEMRAVTNTARSRPYVVTRLYMKGRRLFKAVGSRFSIPFPANARQVAKIIQVRVPFEH